jgi:hypothetical protein
MRGESREDSGDIETARRTENGNHRVHLAKRLRGDPEVS